MVLVADNRLSKQDLRVLVADLIDYGELSESSKVLILDALPEALIE